MNDLIMHTCGDHICKGCFYLGCLGFLEFICVLFFVSLPFEIYRMIKDYRIGRLSKNAFIFKVSFYVVIAFLCLAFVIGLEIVYGGAF